jgi:spore coat protein CotH
MKFRPAIAGVVLLAGILTGVSASAQTAGELFAADTLHEVRLFMNSRDLQDLRAHYLDRTHYTVDLLWRGSRVRNAAVRSRGTGSANSVKPGLLIEFDRYTAGQRFLGMRSLVLDNLWQDPSMLRERLAMALFARMDQAAPRQSFCRLFINNEYQGLYAVTEEPSADFAARTLGEADGYVFEFRWVMAFYASYLGAEPAAYKPLFSARTHALEADSSLYGPIEQLFRRINEPLDGAWRERMEEYIDLSQFVTQVAIEAFVAEDDGVLGYAGMNNFYLYRTRGQTRHRLFPWDKDHAFHSIGASVVGRAGENELFRRALTYPDLRDLYLQALEQCARAAAEDGWLATEIDGQATLIASAAHADVRKQYSNDDFEQAIEFLRQFARERPAFVLAEIAAIRGRVAASARRAGGVR